MLQEAEDENFDIATLRRRKRLWVNSSGSLAEADPISVMQLVCSAVLSAAKRTL